MEPTAEIEATIKRYYAAARAGYLDDATELVSRQPGVVVIGTDPDEWWDAEAYNRAMRAQAEALGGSIPIHEGELNVTREGSVAWFVDRPVFRFDDGLEAEARVTGILHQEANGWRLVHLHVSVGVPNEEALGRDLPG